ncbi:MAG: hypothetical protein RL033_907 [Pseudomonadota bacterium]
MTIAKAYGLAMQSVFNGEIDFDTATVKCMLASSSYTPDQDVHRYKSSITNEVTGTGYTAGGVTLSGKTVTYNTSTNTLTLDANDPVWTASTFTARFGIFYVSTGVDATSPLLCYYDFETDQSVVGNSFTIQLPATGLIYGVVA